MKSDTTRDRLLRALDLPANAPDGVIYDVVRSILGDNTAEDDPRETVRDMAERIADEKHLSFRDSLAVVQAREPALMARLSEFYHDLRERGR